MKTQAYIYTYEVSAKESSKENFHSHNAISTQIRLCEQYAQENEIDIAGYFGGPTETAERLQLKAMLRQLASKEAELILVVGFDRLGRGVCTLQKAIQTILDAGAEIIAVRPFPDYSKLLDIMEKTNHFI